MNLRCSRLATLAAFGLALGALGCDSTQPDQITSTTASLAVYAEALVDNNDCWQVWEDTDGNGTPDQNTGVVVCAPITGEGQKAVRLVPWRFSIQVSLLRAGQTTAEVIGTSVETGGSIPLYASMTPYDATDTSVGAARLPEPPYYFLNPVRVSNGSEYWLAANGYDLGQPNVLEETPTYNFTLGVGDTVIVEARKQPVDEAPAYLPPDTDPQLTIYGTLSLSGGDVQLQGQSRSTVDDKSGISFSYTRR